MRLAVVTPPAPIVSLDEAKAHLRVDHTDEDAGIAALLAVATAWLDGPGGWLGRCLGEQTLRLSLPAFADGLPLPCGPVIAVEQVSYRDPGGATQILPATSAFVEADDTLRLAPGFVPPALADRGDALALTYRAGHPVADDGSSTVPPPIRHAVLLMAAHLYSNRDAVTTTAAQPAQLPFGVEALLAPFRVWA